MLKKAQSWLQVKTEGIPVFRSPEECRWIGGNIVSVDSAATTCERVGKEQASLPSSP